jgi:tetratricopeptide (TPR) repeat protein
MLRLPPSEPRISRPWEQVATLLREEPGELDQFARARLERDMIESWRARGARSVPLPAARRQPSRTAWLASIAASAACGALFGLYVLRHQDASVAMLPEVPARFDLVIDDGAVQSGYLTEGQVLESGQHGHIEVALDQSRVDVAPDSHVRFERLARNELRLALMKGRVDVAFHPERKGEQHMSIETRSARVLVVGTQFAVEIDAEGNTKVSVSEGVVQVVPRSEGETKFVRAGERIEVPLQAERERVQAVREVIESGLRAETEEPPAQQPIKVEWTSGDVRTREARRLRCAEEGTPDQRLEAARGLLLQGRHSAARERLHKLSKKNTLATSTRVEALVLMAESYTAQGQIARASDAYRDAVSIAPHHPAGYNALFALARLLERYTDDRSAAGSVYREYLERAPHGALVPQAREALCRLGDAAACER